MLEMMLTPLPSGPRIVDKWGKLANSPTPARNLHRGVGIGGKFYIVGGQTSTGGTSLTDLLMYDPALNTWAAKTSLPVAREYHTAVAIGTKIYVYGGAADANPGTSQAVLIYDSVTDSWSSSTAVGPSGRSAHSACAGSDGKMYIFSGTSYTNDLWVYDPTLDSWTKKASGATSRSFARMASMDGVVYLHGGFADDASYPNTIWTYTIATNVWAQIATTTKPNGRKDHIFEAIDGKLYMGQGTNSSNYPNDMWVYDPTTNLWTARSTLITGRSNAAHAVIGRKIFVSDGSGQNVNDTSLSLYQYEI